MVFCTSEDSLSFLFVQVVPINVSCTRSEFQIQISRQSLPPLDDESIYLGNPACPAQITPTAYKILSRFDSICGTANQVKSFLLCLSRIEQDK